ncbi:hypothetical protein SAMN05216262_1259 [Colwellia chukchiensis]|uniref:Uncharacterized protein n=1 Tax=Colwellia chukchiensis TaxID=641665 RepID=A0A1H7TGV0_9GAMM|nr:hypothetical protein [Colwellia chukchiensis]SEL83566.1 hypothetical protein SAMN05216262_1259 [Colwellia chukchiensis]
MQAQGLITKSALLSVSLLLLITSVSAFSANIDQDRVDIPVTEDARIFAQFNEQTPAVLNYFTTETEANVIAFYQKHYGEPKQRERKRGRLTLRYQQDSLKIRVVISQQNQLRQVDVMVEKALSS